MSALLFLNENAECRAITRRSPILDSAPINASLRPSACAASRASWLRVTNGRTAMDASALATAAGAGSRRIAQRLATAVASATTATARIAYGIDRRRAGVGTVSGGLDDAFESTGTGRPSERTTGRGVFDAACAAIFAAACTSATRLATPGPTVAPS